MSRKNSKNDIIGNPSTIANAMYDAQKKEITSSMVLSLSFIVAGLVVAVIGIFQYFSIKHNMTDSSENIDAMAWVVIAGVGLLVGAIGLISILKSVVSLGQIGSWAKEAESHASPFQAQKLNRKVAAMNQAQSMDKPDIQAAAEVEGAQKQKRSFFKRGKEAKSKQNSDDLYYKYNPQEKKQTAPPPKAAPIMEQKFDYGIEEEKKLTFADEFLKKNKRDPFAQYRKDLGIQEEPEQEVKQKPKFISNHAPRNNTSSAAPVPQVNMQAQGSAAPNQSTSPILGKSDVQQETSSFNFDKEENKNDDGLDFAMSLLTQNDNIPQQNVQPEQPKLDLSQEFTRKTQAEEAVEAPIQQAETAVTGSSPYGVHNEEDDDIFFSAKTSAASVQQNQSTPPLQQQKQTQTQQNQAFVPNLAAAMAMAEPKSKQPVQPTVMLDLDYNKKRSSEEYDFSLFEEIDPSKRKQTQQKENTFVSSANASAPASQPKQSNSDYDDMFFGAASQSKQKEEQGFVSSFNGSSKNQPAAKQLNYSVQTENAVKSTAIPPVQMNTQPMQPAPSTPTIDFVRPADNEPLQERAPGPVVAPPIPIAPQQQPQAVEQQQKKKKSTTPSKTKMTRSKKGGGKKSFSEAFLSKNGSNADNNESEIVKNGTRAQRKFVDASEYDEWSCPQCGKVNQEYVGICACGARKPRPRKNH